MREYLIPGEFRSWDVIDLFSLISSENILVELLLFWLDCKHRFSKRWSTLWRDHVCLHLPTSILPLLSQCHLSVYLLSLILLSLFFLYVYFLVFPDPPFLAFSFCNFSCFFVRFLFFSKGFESSKEEEPLILRGFPWFYQKGKGRRVKAASFATSIEHLAGQKSWTTVCQKKKPHVRNVSARTILFPKGPKIEKIQDLEIFKQDWNFQARRPPDPIFFMGYSEGRDWNFQARLKFSSGIENFNWDWNFSIFGPLGFDYMCAN